LWLGYSSQALEAFERDAPAIGVPDLTANGPGDPGRARGGRNTAEKVVPSNIVRQQERACMPIAN
jgi:hypothetical protein